MTKTEYRKSLIIIWQMETTDYHNEKSSLLSLHLLRNKKNTACINLKAKLVPKCRLLGQNCTYLSYHELSDSVALACCWKDFPLKEQDSSPPPN
jgi:hypothetical protein